MTKAGIFVANAAAQSITAGNTINLGTTIRRYGCNCELTTSGIACSGQGYYDVDATVTVTTTAAGTVTVSALKDGTAITGATSSYQFTETTGGTATLPIVGMFKKGCPCCDTTSVITFVLSGSNATVNNIAAKVERV